MSLMLYRKRFASFFCLMLSAAILAVSLSPLTLCAAEAQPEAEPVQIDVEEGSEELNQNSSEDEIEETYEGIILNPFWEGVFTDEELTAFIMEAEPSEESSGSVRPGGPLKAQAKNTFTTYDEMVECLRNALIGRKTSVKIFFDVDGLDVSSGIELGNRVYEDALSRMTPYQAAMVAGCRISASTFRDKPARGTLSYTMNAYFNTDEQEALFEETLRTTVDGLDIYSADDYTKIKTIYEYVINHVTYDNEHLNDSSYKLKYTAYAALIDRMAVCQGYALLLYRMAAMAGLNVRYITGVANGGNTSGNHAWNAVRLDGKYYLLDSTWDSAGWYPKYFLRGTSSFNTDHMPGSDYPVDDSYSTTDYVAQETYGVNAQEVILTPADESVYSGNVLYLAAQVLPDNAIDKRLTWSSSNEQVAIVDEHGAVTGISDGSATITATTVNGISGSAQITVVGNADYVYVSSFRLTGDAEMGLVVVQYNSGSPCQLTWEILPENATDQTVTFRSDDPSVAAIDEEGKITGVRPGLTNAYVYPNGRTNENLAVLCQVQVAGVHFGTDAVEMMKGDSYTFSDITVFPQNTRIYWSSSDSSVAKVDNSGVITAVGSGNCSITAMTAYGEMNRQTIPVTVHTPVSGVTLDRSTASLRAGESLVLQATVSPEDADDRSVTWSSSDASIATVDDNGTVTAFQPGKATITASTKNGEFTAKCEVTVSEAYIPLKSLDIMNANEGKTHVRKGKQKQIELFFMPANATDKSVTWESADESIFTVNSDGVIIGVSAGTAKLHVTGADGISTSVSVVVTVDTTAIQLDKTSLTLIEGEASTIKATVQPSDASNKTVIWKSSDTSVASVDANGRITAVKQGKATIAAATADTGKTASCTITVSPKTILQTCDSNPALAWEFKDGKYYWYENGVKQAVAGDPKNIIDQVYGHERGREIYDPCSDGWYWLDSVYDGAKAANKEVWMPYIYQEEAKWSENEIVRNSMTSGGQTGQVIDAIHNREGKWVRYDANGKMVKGWYTVSGSDAGIYPSQAGNTYYYDKMTGLMAKGWIVIDGVKYHFDEISGALIK